MEQPPIRSAISSRRSTRQQVQENKLHMWVTDSGWAKFGWGKIYGQWIAGATSSLRHGQVRAH